MKFRLNSLVLGLRRGEVVIDFADVSYFWGQMGAGKTSIVRMIDYCLGGDIELSPAMQSEFVTATLNLSLARGDVSIERPRDATNIIANWGAGDSAFSVTVPARRADGEVLPGTGVEQLSDLLFWLNGINPPRVRKSKLNEDSETNRLSIRDLLWYCILDQDEIDSSFFQLEDAAPFYKRLKSRDVLRYVVGFHDERVAELEATLDQLRGERHALSGALAALTQALKEVGVNSELEISERISALVSEAEQVQSEIEAARHAADTERQTTHAADQLRERARSLGVAIAEIDDAIVSIRESQARDQRHLHEIETLSLKFRRSISARAVLVGVNFQSCPRCAQLLPEREKNCCFVCGQTDQVELIDPTDSARVERDAKIRISELAELLAKHSEQLARLKQDRNNLSIEKNRVERERNEALNRYDTAYLSTMLTKERKRASLLQEVENLSELGRLPKMVEAQKSELAAVIEKERQLRTELKGARADAESDETILTRLKSFFLDCLVRAGVPGITPNDRVEISPMTFFPTVHGPDLDDLAVTTFSNLSSGGKKTLFKCCFAIAVHRLAVQLKAPLPQFLIIDSPMKNISERENRDQFEGFYRMLYELKDSELGNIQLILVDKEFSPPESVPKFSLIQRHMRPGDSESPPLIPYYEGK